MVWRSFPEVVCQCYRAPLAHTDINTFLVTPGADSGRHLYTYHRLKPGKTHGKLPDLGDGHGLIHVAVEGVTGLPSECVENADCTVTMTSSNVFVIGVESDTESLLRCVSQRVLVSHLYIRVLHYLQTIVR